jgi:hypothetical protein
MLILYFIFDWIFIFPLRIVYLKGFYNGSSDADVCHSITGVSSTYWLARLDDCVHIIHLRLFNFTVSVAAVLYFILLLYILARVVLYIPTQINVSRITRCNKENKISIE